MTTATDKQAPAWERFSAMSAEVHDMLIGAAQCKNHLWAILESWDESTTDDERHEAVATALDRLTEVGI